MLRSTVWIVYTTVTVISLLASVCDGMQCPTCDKIHCSPRKASRLKCKGGITTGICNCCPACAKLEGQKCGGDFNYLGKCDKGLYCKPQKKNITVFIRKDPVGTCQRGKCYWRKSVFVYRCFSIHFKTSRMIALRRKIVITLQWLVVPKRKKFVFKTVYIHTIFSEHNVTWTITTAWLFRMCCGFYVGLHVLYDVTCQCGGRPVSSIHSSGSVCYVVDTFIPTSLLQKQIYLDFICF